MSEKQKYWTNWYVDSLMFKKEDIQNWKKQTFVASRMILVSTKIFAQTVLLVLTYLIRPSTEFLSQLLIDTRLTLGLTNIKKQMGFLAPNIRYVCQNWMFLQCYIMKHHNWIEFDLQAGLSSDCLIFGYVKMMELLSGPCHYGQTLTDLFSLALLRLLQKYCSKSDCLCHIPKFQLRLCDGAVCQTQHKSDFSLKKQTSFFPSS